MESEKLELSNNLTALGSWQWQDGEEGGEIEIYMGAVVDYDGCYDLPNHIKKELDRRGITH